jgi:uncharacterized protein (DUF1800 family)
MRDQNELYRVMGRGPFRDTLLAVTRNPAMLIYLDNRENRVGKAQENYAREVMELFSMGVGNYSENDVREIARAFTGETIDGSCANNWPFTYLYFSLFHDSQPKIVFGDQFNFTTPGADTEHVIDLILNRISGAVSISPFHADFPAVSLYMAWKFITWFVYEEIPITHEAVAELANIFYNNQPNGYSYDVAETLRALLKSQLFYDSAYRYRMHKHPADYAVMALRTLGLPVPLLGYAQEARKSLAGMGMELFNPPNVAGWNHSKAWNNSGTTIARFNLANDFSSFLIATDAWCDGLISAGHVTSFTDHAGIIEYFRARLLQTSLEQAESDILLDFLNDIENSLGSAQAKYRRKVRGMIHLVMAMPRYQLK